ncbi:MAG: DUF4296 domain-containing protein [Muribaculaceae bacterium]
MRKLLPVIALAIVAAACNRVPDSVIQPDDMAELMADVRVADAVISVNQAQYAAPGTREALRDAVFARHGVTKEQFDSSLVWYGHNMNLYQDVADHTIEILEARLAKVNGVVAEAALSVAGDSVDVWQRPTALIVNSFSPSQYITFNLTADRNWERGDFFTWNARLAVPPTNAQWSMTTEYSDGTIETVIASLDVTELNRQSITFFTDTTRTAVALSGWLYLGVEGRRPCVVDSISLTRSRITMPNQPYRRMQRRVVPRLDPNDSTRTL